jgi:glycosyltransferase involved in cell wall biosynthesis
VYQLFDVFLLTSFSEGISVTLLESMASSVPSVVTDVGGNREVVVEGETGYLVPVDADQEMAQRVSELLQNQVVAEQMGRTARERVVREFSVQGMMEAYCKLYS